MVALAALAVLARLMGGVKVVICGAFVVAVIALAGRGFMQSRLLFGCHIQVSPVK